MDGFTVSHRKVIALSLYCDKVTQRKGRDEKRDGAKERNKVKRRQEDDKQEDKKRSKKIRRRTVFARNAVNGRRLG